MIKYLATASLLLAGAYLGGGHALAADPGFTDSEILIGDVEPLTGPPATARLSGGRAGSRSGRSRRAGLQQGWQGCKLPGRQLWSPAL